MTSPLTVLVVGATGSIGSLAVTESLGASHRTRALVRDQAKAHRLLPNEADVVVGDVTRPDTLVAAVDGVDAVVLTLGSTAPPDPAPRPSTTQASATCWPPSEAVRSGSP